MPDSVYIDGEEFVPALEREVLRLALEQVRDGAISTDGRWLSPREIATAALDGKPLAATKLIDKPLGDVQQRMIENARAAGRRFAAAIEAMTQERSRSEAGLQQDISEDIEAQLTGYQEDLLKSLCLATYGGRAPSTAECEFMQNHDCWSFIHRGLTEKGMELAADAIGFVER